MECPYCKKDIYGLTGFQEAIAFNKHLRKCKKNPSRQTFVEGNKIVEKNKPTTLLDALNIRAESGQ
jgi:hypothetical protein